MLFLFNLSSFMFSAQSIILKKVRWELSIPMSLSLRVLFAPDKSGKLAIASCREAYLKTVLITKGLLWFTFFYTFFYYTLGFFEVFKSMTKPKLPIFKATMFKLASFLMSKFKLSSLVNKCSRWSSILMKFYCFRILEKNRIRS
jgi:hypothetical protein